MKLIIAAAAAWTILVASFSVPIDLRAERHTIDSQHSTITIRVFKSGVFSIFAHDHSITTSIARGELEDSDHPSVEIWVDATKLRVMDSELSAKDRTEVQKTMEGSEVLDIIRFPEIHFRSADVQKAGANRWTVRGTLDLHGQSHPVTVDVSERNGRYVGSTTLKQRDFGINPISIGGTVRVKDEVKVEFQVVSGLR